MGWVLILYFKKFTQVAKVWVFEEEKPQNC